MPLQLPAGITSDKAPATKKTKTGGKLVMPEGITSKRYQVSVGGRLSDAAKPGREADFWSQVEAKLVDDPATRVRILSENRFPDMPEDERIKRYRQMPSGDIAYSDGADWYRSMSDGSSGLASDMLGHAPTIIGGVAGASVGGIPGGVAGTAGGEAIRQAIGPMLYDQPVDMENSMLAIGKESALTAAGMGVERAVGGGARAVANRHMDPARALGYDPVETARRYAAADRAGVQLTPAEASGSRSLTRQQSYVADQPQTADRMGDFYEGRAGQVDDAIARNLDMISPEQSTFRGQQRGVDALQAENARRRTYRSDQSGPHYDAARNEFADVEFLTQRVLRLAEESQGTPVGSAYRQAYNALTRREQGERVPKETVGQLHDAKMLIDDIIARAHRQGGGKGLEGRLIEVREELVGTIEDVSENYARGRAAYRRTSPPVNRMDQVTGQKVLSRDPFTPPAYEKFADATMGSGKSAVDVLLSRKVLKRQDPDAWNATVKAFLVNKLEAIKESAQGEGIPNMAGRFRKLVFGSATDRRKLRAALEPAQYRALNDFMEVLSAASRVTRGQSATQSRQETAEAVRGGARHIASVLVSLRKSTMDFLDERNMEQHLNELAGMMTSTRNMRDFNRVVNRLRQHSPGRDRYSAGRFEDALTAAMATITSSQVSE